MTNQAHTVVSETVVVLGLRYDEVEPGVPGLDVRYVNVLYDEDSELIK